MRRKLLCVAMTVTLGLGATMASQANTLRMAEASDIASLDPYSVTESNTLGFLHHIYEPLVRYNADLKLEPALATSWEVVEPNVWRFELREGVTFHNGNSLSADDVVASIQRAIDPNAPIRVNVPTVVGARKVGDLTVEILLSTADPLLLNYLTNVYIFDKEWMVENNALNAIDLRKGEENYATTHANGTGPFRLESRQPDAKTVLAVNPKWWDTPQHNLTRIEFTPISSDATRVAALLSGEIDLMYPAPLQDVKRIDSTAGVKVLQAPSLRTIMFGLNQRDDQLHDSDIKDRNPLKDARVRKALYQAINMELIHKKVMRGNSRNSALVVAPEVPGYDAALNQRFPHDPEAAKALLAEAGYPDGFRVGLDCTNDRYVNDEEICQAVVSMWARVGIKANLTAQSKGNHFQKMLGGGSDIYMFGWATLPMLDTFSALTGFLATPADKLGTWNPGGYSNARIDSLIGDISSELDEPKRRAMLAETLEIARDEVAVIPLHQQPLSWGIRDGITLPQTPDDKPRLWYAKVN
ncbi:ABC transporter substrate-binding protein [Marinobacterium rhizophilum]|nr:ABC transporter substrate-binding protein [Marinobacterium rhizophilum]